MDCGRIKKKLSLYIDGEILPEERQAIQEHLKICFSCRREMQKLCTIKKLLHTMGESLEVCLHRRISLDFRHVSRRERLGKLVMVFLFSGVAVIAMLAMVFWQGAQEEANLQKEIAPVSMLTGFDSRVDRVDSRTDIDAIQVVEFTLD